jgi:signal transduction histidine kinase
MQILNNLLNNAIKFTDDGAIFFIVSIEKSEWCFSIADTGIGMTPQQLKNIFTRFNRDRMDQFETTDRPGAGLGMALCKDLVELLDGTIDVYSERNVGTVVKIFLPKNPTNDSI